MVFLIFTESAPRPIQSISCNVCDTKLCHIVQFFYVLLLPLKKVEIQIDWLQKDFLLKSYEIAVVSEFVILAQKW